MFRENKIWNGIGKGKYKLSFHLWVGMWVRKKKLKDTYTSKHSQLVGCTSSAGMRQTLLQKNTSIIWNGIGKAKYKLSFHLWVGMWVRKKKLKYTYTNKHSRNFDVFDTLVAWACAGPSYKITHQ